MSNKMIRYTDSSYIKNWLIICAILVIIMVAIGGYTRLNNAGLSIVEWKPITGIIPPITEAQWLEEFNKYKNSPEYQKINFTIEMQYFKKIYLIEYIHRVAARITALVFLLPFLYFTFTRSIINFPNKRFAFIIMLMMLQGVIGWYMVKSGLINNPAVSSYRLALHLLMACFIFSLIIWEIAIFYKSKTSHFNIKYNINYKLYIFILLIILQITLGAFVAGLNAGMIYNSFPLMNGHLMPNESFSHVKLTTMMDNPALVQFFHRIMAFIILFFASYMFCHIHKYYKHIKIIKFINILLISLIYTQLLLGVITLIYKVPLLPALIHQIIAVFILGNITFLTKFLYHQGD